MINSFSHRGNISILLSDWLITPVKSKTILPSLPKRASIDHSRLEKALSLNSMWKGDEEILILSRGGNDGKKNM